jgi:hypothetical protein
VDVFVDADLADLVATSERASLADLKQLLSWQGLTHSARHVIGCRISQDTRVQNAFDDVASTIYQSI